jgi:hypothetical protein
MHKHHQGIQPEPNHFRVVLSGPKSDRRDDNSLRSGGDAVTSKKKTLAMAAVAALMSVGVLATTVGSASAYVACNGSGDCWHTDQRYAYNPGFGVQIHPDNWYFHHDWDHDGDHHWRNHHDGRGYYRSGVWIGF